MNLSRRNQRENQNKGTNTQAGVNSSTSESVSDSRYQLRPERAAELGIPFTALTPEIPTNKGKQVTDNSVFWRVTRWAPLVLIGFCTVLFLVSFLLLRPKVVAKIDSFTDTLTEQSERIANIETSISLLMTPTSALSQITPMPIISLSNVEISQPEDIGLVQADNRKLTFIVLLLDSNRNRYMEPTIVQVVIEEGEGQLEPQPPAQTTTTGDLQFSYLVGETPGPVKLVVTAGSITQEINFVVQPILPYKIEMNFSPQTPLIADEVATTTLDIRLLKNEQGDVLNGTTEIQLNVDQPDLIHISPDSPYIAVNGALSLRITAKSGLATPATVTLTASVGGVSASYSLNLTPNYLHPDLRAQLGSMCKVIDANGSKGFFRDDLTALRLFEVPIGSAVGCRVDTNRGTNEVAVIVWIPETNITTVEDGSELLIFDLEQPPQVFLGFDPPSTDTAEAVNLLPDANELVIERTGRKSNDYIEVFIRGWMVRAVLEEIS